MEAESVPPLDSASDNITGRKRTVDDVEGEPLKKSGKGKKSKEPDAKSIQKANRERQKIIYFKQENKGKIILINDHQNQCICRLDHLRDSGWEISDAPENRSRVFYAGNCMAVRCLFHLLNENKDIVAVFKISGTTQDQQLICKTLTRSDRPPRKTVAEPDYTREVKMTQKMNLLGLGPRFLASGNYAGFFVIATEDLKANEFTQVDKTWRKIIHNTPGKVVDVLTRSVKLMDHLRFKHYVHGDLHFGNIFFDPDITYDPKKPEHKIVLIDFGRTVQLTDDELKAPEGEEGRIHGLFALEYLYFFKEFLFELADIVNTRQYSKLTFGYIGHHYVVFLFMVDQFVLRFGKAAELCFWPDKLKPPIPPLHDNGTICQCIAHILEGVPELVISDDSVKNYARIMKFKSESLQLLINKVYVPFVWNWRFPTNQIGSSSSSSSSSSVDGDNR
jgi:hypothetical protein